MVFGAFYLGRENWQVLIAVKGKSAAKNVWNGPGFRPGKKQGNRCLTRDLFKKIFELPEHRDHRLSAF